LRGWVGCGVVDAFLDPVGCGESAFDVAESFRDCGVADGFRRVTRGEAESFRGCGVADDFLGAA
jgi:hypothetical protein